MKVSKFLILAILFSNFLVAQVTPPTVTTVTTLDTDDVNVLKVEIKNFQYHVFYYDKNNNLKEWISNVTRDNVYSNSRVKYWNFSVMTIPFKVRPRIEGLKPLAKADIKNAGLNIGVRNTIWKYFLPDGTINEYKLSYGIIIAPSAEEFNSLNTLGEITTATTQMVLSTGLNIAGTYRGINFAIIPVGFDFGLTKDAHEWVYDKKYWFGIGLGLDSKLIGF